jgi:hypothetical protein
MLFQLVQIEEVGQEVRGYHLDAAEDEVVALGDHPIEEWRVLD